MNADNDTLRELLASWLIIWESVEEFVSDDEMWERGEDLAEWTRTELSGEDVKITRCPNCNSLKIVPCDDLRDDDGHCIEWECEECGCVINNY